MDPWNKGSATNLTPKHQRLIVWRKDGIVENIEAGQSYYKVDEAKATKKSFDKHLANIAPYDDESGSYTSINTGRVLNLDPGYGFIQDTEEAMKPKVVNPPMGWPAVDEDDH